MRAICAVAAVGVVTLAGPAPYAVAQGAKATQGQGAQSHHASAGPAGEHANHHRSPAAGDRRSGSPKEQAAPLTNSIHTASVTSTASTPTTAAITTDATTTAAITTDATDTAGMVAILSTDGKLVHNAKSTSTVTGDLKKVLMPPTSAAPAPGPLTAPNAVVASDAVRLLVDTVTRAYRATPLIALTGAAGKSPLALTSGAMATPHRAPVTAQPPAVAAPKPPAGAAVHHYVEDPVVLVAGPWKGFSLSTASHLGVPIGVAILVGVAVLLQAFFGRRDPRLSEAPTSAESETIPFT